MGFGSDDIFEIAGFLYVAVSGNPFSSGSYLKVIVGEHLQSRHLMSQNGATCDVLKMYAKKCYKYYNLVSQSRRQFYPLHVNG